MTPIMTPIPPLSEQRVLDLIDAYGGSPTRWPEGERAAAVAMIASTPALQTAMDQALALDGLLDTLPDPVPSPAFRVALKAIPDQHQGIDWLAVLWPFGSPWRPAMGLTAALALGLVFGIATPPSDTDALLDAPEIVQDTTAASNPLTLAGLSAFGGGSDTGFGLIGYSTEGDL